MHPRLLLQPIRTRLLASGASRFTSSGALSYEQRHELLDWKLHHAHFHPVIQFNVVTFNLLAPVYKRLQAVDITTGFRKRESQKSELWSARAQRTIEFFRDEVLGHTDIIGLQEFWMESSYRDIFEEDFVKRGYDLFTAKRPNQKLDGLALVIKSSVFEVLATEYICLCPTADRVALLLWMRHRDTGKDFLVANTHLSFPHSHADRMEQMNQMQTLTRVMDKFAARYNIMYASRAVMGDFNVESKSPVCDHLRAEGYRSCFEVSPPSNAEDLDSPSTSDEVRFISHRTHRAEDLGVDHIFVKPEAVLFDDRAAERQASSSTLHPHASDAYPRCSVGSHLPEHHECRGPQFAEGLEERMFVYDCYVLPKVRTCGLWDETFRLSDHRPVSATIVFAQPSGL